MSEFILHHYPPSPVSEKIRTAFGLKNLSWYSVEQNRLPVRPELFAMTGGYRRIPVLQVGADIYCDTQLIFRELERRAPTPGFHPGTTAGLAFGMSRWIDVEFFELCVRAAFAPIADTAPAELLADRTQLYFGAEGDMQREAADMPHTLSQLRAHLGWLEESLENSTPFMLGQEPGMADILAWYVVWFVRGRYIKADSFLAEFPLLNAWSQRMEAIGHGQATAMTPAEALAVAREAEPDTTPSADANDPQGLTPGMNVTVVPLSRNTTETPVAGIVQSVSRDAIALKRHHENCGEVVVHFPRVGYRVSAA